MRRFVDIMIVLCLAGGVLAFDLLRSPRAQIRPRGSVLRNLRQLEDVKQQWILERKPIGRKPLSNTWPSLDDLRLYLARGDAKSLDEVFAPLQGEIYVINRADRPVAVYLTKDSFGRKAGQFLTIEDIESGQGRISTP